MCKLCDALFNAFVAMVWRWVVDGVRVCVLVSAEVITYLAYRRRKKYAWVCSTCVDGRLLRLVQVVIFLLSLATGLSARRSGGDDGGGDGDARQQAKRMGNSVRICCARHRMHTQRSMWSWKVAGEGGRTKGRGTGNKRINMRVTCFLQIC